MRTRAEAETTVRAGCYLRISSDPDDKREGVDRQREDTTALCEVKGWTPVDFYPDNDRSASNGKQRPQWDRMLADIKAGKIDAIAAWDQDRGWRMMHELEDLRRFFASLGRPVALATTGQGDIDLFSPTGVMMAQIKTAVSEHEIAMMKVRQRRAAKQKAERGIPQWRHAFGYLRYTGTKEDDVGWRDLDPVAAPLVARAYTMIINGCSLGDIATMLNDAEAFGLRGHRWTHTTVSLFLRKPRNAGLRDHRGEIVGTGTWPALVDESTWHAAQHVLNEDSRKPGPKSVRQHLLTGLLMCGKCGHHLAGAWTSQKGPGGVQIAYACKKCRGCSVRAEYIEPVVRAIITGRLAMPDAVDLLRAQHHDEEHTERLRVQRRSLLTRRGEIADERADGLIDGPGYRRMTERIDREIAAIDAQQADAEKVRIFDGLPLGTDEVATAITALTPDRYRAVVTSLVALTIKPVGKGHRPGDGQRFDPERVMVAWR